MSQAVVDGRSAERFTTAMTNHESQGKHGLVSEAALQRQAERAATKKAREAEALRANLKRRKEQVRGRVLAGSVEQAAPLREPMQDAEAQAGADPIE